MRLLSRLRSFAFAAATAALLCASASESYAGVAINISIGPPALHVYVQPPCPADGYIWSPGYWAWGPAGYYWVPGVWVRPPRVGVLWTPGYWGFAGGSYLWHAGFWGPHVGFYGGINYGFGYTGVGFIGGGWAGGVFRYNTAVTNVNTTVVRNVYVDRTVINRTTIVNNRMSFNGPGGVNARPTFQEQAAMREQHFQPTPNQISHANFAAQDRNQLASVNHGRPGTMAMASPRQAFNGNQVNDRRYDQQQRIAQGVRSGQLTPGETARVENREQHINNQVHADRQANGGTLTPQERRQVNHEQNRASQQIHEERHNGHEAPR